MSIHKYQRVSQNTSGQSLLEVILAMAIFAAIAGTLITMSVGGFRGLEQGGEQTEAEALAEEGIEAIKSIRDRAWNESIPCTTCVVSNDGTKWNIVAGASEPNLGTNGKFTRTITFNNVCRDNTSQNIVDCGTCGATCYTDVQTKKATVAVTWTTRGGQSNTVQKVAYTTNWDSRDLVQDTNFSCGAGGSTGICADTELSSLGDGSSVTLKSALWLGGYKFRKKLTINGAQVPNAQSSFPVLVSFPTGDPDLVRDIDCTVVDGPCSASGFDIVFSQNHVAKLDHEIEKYASTTGEIIMWVRFDPLPAADTDFYVYYGDPAIILSQENINAVWDANYVGVWHFNEGDSTAPNFYENSGAPINHGTLVDTAGGTVQATGQIGFALDLEGGVDADANDDYINIGSDPSLDDLHLTGGMTVSAWVRPDGATATGNLMSKRDASSCAGEYSMLFDQSSGTIGFYKKGTTNYFRNSAAGAFVNNALQHITMTWDGSAANINTHHYVGNSSGVRSEVTYGLPSTDGVGLGSDAICEFAIGTRKAPSFQAIEGIIDEFHLSNIVRTPNWMTIEYNNQVNQGIGATKFIKSAGTEEPKP